MRCKRIGLQDYWSYLHHSSSALCIQSICPQLRLFLIWYYFLISHINSQPINKQMNHSNWNKRSEDYLGAQKVWLRWPFSTEILSFYICMSNRLPSALFDLDEYIFFLILDNICRLCYQESTDMCLCVYSSYYYRFVAAVTGSWSHYLFTHSSEADIVKQLTYFQTTLLVIFHNGHHSLSFTV